MKKTSTNLFILSLLTILGILSFTIVIAQETPTLQDKFNQYSDRRAKDR